MIHEPTPALFRQQDQSVKDAPRLSAQCHAILKLLVDGPVTNRQLAVVALKYTSRLSDLRAAGHTITCKHLHDGLTEYRLEANP